MEIIHMTAAYSNAVLVAVMPYVNDFATKLHLPIPLPVTTNQIERYVASPFKEYIGAGVWLTNGYWFAIDWKGYVNGYRCPTNGFSMDDFADVGFQKYLGKDTITTNEAIELARESLLKVGFKPNLTHSGDAPTVEGSFDLRNIGHVPYCRISWKYPKGEDARNHVAVEVNLESKEIAGMSIILSYTNKFDTVPLKVDVPTELESDYQKRTNPKMFIRTNAPKVPYDPD